jgi:hypothetical protein
VETRRGKRREARCGRERFPRARIFPQSHRCPDSRPITDGPRPPRAGQSGIPPLS